MTNEILCGAVYHLDYATDLPCYSPSSWKAWDGPKEDINTFAYFCAFHYQSWMEYIMERGDGLAVDSEYVGLGDDFPQW